MSVRIGWIGPSRDGRRQFHLLHVRRIAGGSGRQVIVGWHRYSRGELEELRADGVTLRVWALGIVSFTPDVSPVLVDAVLTDMVVHGVLRGRPARVASADAR